VVGTIGILAIAGCDTVRAPGAAVADPLPAGAYPQIEAADGLQGFIVYGEPKVSRDRIMSVTVPIRAATDHEDVRVQYRFQFFDRNGVPIGDEPSWRYTKLASRRQEMLQGNAIDSGAADWRLQIRPAR
jgi:hypothetical protein